MARRVKTLLNNPNERNHREHRSKKGRSKYNTKIIDEKRARIQRKRDKFGKDF